MIQALWGAILLPLAACSQDRGDAVDAGSGSGGGGGGGVPTLRIQRAHAFDAGAGHVEQLTARVNGCRRAQGLAPTDTLALPALDKLNLTETEELFDGERHAVYRTTTFLAPDATQGCALAAFTERSVDIETSCGTKLRGMTTPVRELIDTQARTPFAVTIENDPPVGAGCDKRQPAQAPAGLPVEQLPGGASCVWNHAMAARQLDARAAVQPGPAADGFDTCVHAKHPVYPYSDASGQPLSVVLRSHAPRSLEAVQMLGASNDMGAENLVSYTEGSAIAPSRFTRGDAEAFLNQPHKRALGAAKP